MENTNVYEKPVTLKNILKFAVPTIAMTVFMSFYTMVDGLFVSNLIGTNALSAINRTAPIIQLVTAVSTMLATGGNAIISRKMGARQTPEASSCPGSLASPACGWLCLWRRDLCFSYLCRAFSITETDTLTGLRLETRNCTAGLKCLCQFLYGLLLCGYKEEIDAL